MKTKAGSVLAFASRAEDKARAELTKIVNEGNAHDAKNAALEVLAWQAARDIAYREASEEERAEWRKQQNGSES